MKKLLVLFALLFSSFVHAQEDPRARVERLLFAASELSGYAIPEDHRKLAIYTVSEDVMNAIYCRGAEPCRTPLGIYQDAGVIVLIPMAPQELDAAIVHELVHWLQHQSGKWPSTRKATCQNFYDREVEAYKAMNRYIVEHQKRPPTDQFPIPINLCSKHSTVPSCK
jgi:hypothetical protein